MGKLNKFFTKINHPLNSSNLIEWLGVTFWLLIFLAIVFFIAIPIFNSLIWSPSISGFNSLFDIFKVPLALLASSIAILTIRITMKRVIQFDQQLASYNKPELYIMDSTLHIITSNNKEYKNKFVFTTSGMMNERPYLKIYNIGLAAATKIRCYFDYEFKNLFGYATFNRNDDIGINIKLLSQDTVRIKIDKINYREICLIDINEKDFNFLLPTSDGSINLTIYIPKIYCELFNCYCLSLYKTGSTDSEGNEIIYEPSKISEFPELRVILSYINLAGYILRKEFEIKFVQIDPYIYPIKVDGTLLETSNKFSIQVRENNTNFATETA